ncbi:MAG TPA: ATPase, T2SS/T4P/T4SS family, partial [Vicinamibacteria bacterium]|nr:ATPase, T2SS/T4P/T4SS family [Vicinamibacteria bacterium]
EAGGTPYWERSSPDGVLDSILELGARKHASEVNLEPTPQQVEIRYGIDGFSFRVEPVPTSFAPALERALFAMFGLDSSRRSRAQTGRALLRLQEEEYDVLARTVPSRHGVGATVRLVNRAAFIKDFGTLGLELEDRVRLVEVIRSGRGLVLVSSPPFNGAVTTCYSILNFLARVPLDVASVESPVQWRLDGVRQVEAEVDERGPCLEAALRPLLAAGAQAVVVSAVPDQSTARLLAEAAPGLLAVAQVTAPTAAQAVAAVRGLGVPPDQLAQALALATGQRLVREICPDCRVPAEPPPEDLLASLGLFPEDVRAVTFYKGRGCAACHTVGYRGRRAIFETLPVSPEVRAAVEQGSPVEEIHRFALDAGMIDLRTRCLALVASGTTTLEELARLRL